MITKIDPLIISYEKKIQGLCKIPFYGHNKGCPNYRKKEGCPPNLPLINNILDFKKDIYIIYTEFRVGEFAERIRITHSEWNSVRQWYNPRYWQPKARKSHHIEEEKALKENKLEKIVNSPEAYGVNITKLMKGIGIDLSWGWPPKHDLRDNAFQNNISYLISLGGYPLK